METVDLTSAREKAAAIEASAVSATPPAQKTQPTQQELDALEVLKGSPFFKGEDALGKLVGKAASRQGAKELPAHELDRRISHKETRVAKAKTHVESCQTGVAEAKKKLEHAEAEAAGRCKELADLVATRDARAGQDRTTAFFQSMVGGDANLASILPAIAEDDGM